MNIKRFFITLGLSVLIWLISVFLQALLSLNTSFNLFGSACTITGFPIATCIYERKGQVPASVIALTNIAFWFWVLHFSWKWFNKGKSSFGK